MDVIGYREDEQTFLELVRQLLTEEESQLRLGTGYLNIQKELFAELMRSKSSIELLTSSPKANGFYQAGRVKKFIPGLYRCNELNMLKAFNALPKEGRPSDFGIYEYLNGDWTFHGKGAWLYE